MQNVIHIEWANSEYRPGSPYTINELTHDLYTKQQSHLNAPMRKKIAHTQFTLVITVQQSHNSRKEKKIMIII